MMIVRFPTGFSVQYNAATYALRGQNGYTDLYTEKNETTRKWIAQVPNTALIEVTAACKTWHAGTGEQLDQLLKSLHARTVGSDWATAQTLKRIKLALVDFDARRGRWK